MRALGSRSAASAPARPRRGSVVARSVTVALDPRVAVIGDQILLKADADGPGWTDQQIAYAISCRTKTVENIRERCVLEGFERALERKRRALPQGLKLLDGEQEAQVIALRLGSPPKGYANWSLRLLARRVVELGVVESVSHETIRRTLKKTR